MADESRDSIHSNHGSPLPNVNERLAQLRPSKELLEYYRRKIAEFDNEHQEMLAKLDKYKCTYEEQHKLQWELRQREEEIAELQKALSDMQVYLFQERENVLRLFAENDRLKIRELEDRKKIQHLLSLTKPSDTEVTYFIKDHPLTSAGGKKNVLANKENRNRCVQGRGAGGHRKVTNQSEVLSKQTAPRKAQNSKSTSSKDPSNDMQVLLLQIESLQAQIEEQAKLAKDQEESLLEDRKVRMEEQNAQRQRDADKIKALTEHLHKTQTLLYESTKDFLELKYEGRRKERRWMMERDTIMQEMDAIKEQLDIEKSDVIEVHESTHYVDAATGTGPDQISSEFRPTNAMIISSLKSSLQQAQRLSEMYREQVIGLEDELARIREENDVGKDIFQDRTEKMTNRLQLMNQRYEALEKRRALEVEGFKNDIKLLRAKLKEVEKQLFKVTVNLGDQFDFEILQHTRKTAGRSKKVVDELRGLKAKIYSMENDVRHLQV